MPAPDITHDIVIEEFDAGNRTGFMLKRNRAGLRNFSVVDAETIRPRQLAMGEFTQAEFPPQLEVVWYEENWELGIGKLNHRLDPKGVQSGQKIDLSEPGIMQPARELRASTLNSAPDKYYPSGFAIAPSDDTPGTAGILAEIWAFVGRDIYSGGDDNFTLETEPQSLDVYYKNGIQFGKYIISPALYAGSDVQDAAMPYIYKDPNAAAWVASTLTTGRFKFFTLARDFAGQAVIWGGNHIFNTGRTISGSHSSGDTTLTLDSNPVGTIAINDMILVGAAGAQEICLVTAVSSSDPHLTVVRGYGITAQSFSDADKVYLYQPHVIKSSTSIENSTGSWSTATKIGEDDQPITGMTTVEDTDEVLVAKTNGVFSYSFDEFGRLQTRNLTPEFRQQQHTGNFLGIYSWNKHILLPTGAGGLLDFNPETRAIKNISFKRLASETTTYHGTVLALHGDSEFLFMMLKDRDSEKIYLLQGKEITFEGVTEFRWSPVSEMGAGAVITNAQTGLMVESALNDHRRVWLGFTESSVNETPRFYPFGDINDDQTDGFTNDTTTPPQVITKRYDFNLPRVPKHISKIEVGSNNLDPSSGRHIKFERRMDEAAFELGDYATESPSQELDIPHGTSGKIMDLRITFFQTSVSTTNPQLEYFRVTAQIHPNPQRLYPLTVVVADDTLLLNGATESKSKKQLDLLKEWNGSPSDVTIFTPDNEEGIAVIFLPGTLRIKQTSHEAGRRPEYEASFILAEV
jgi:hypothetical protein